jgi:hypothetical protein
MPPWLRDLLHRADADLMAGGYHAVSVDAERVRRQLRTAGRAYVDPGSPSPSLADLDATAHWIVGQSRFTSGALGGLAGLAGAASVPPEIAAQGVGVVRLAQRLAVVYGFDPSTDRGRTALWRALAAGLSVEVSDGPVALRVSDVPALLRPHVGARSVGTVLAHAVVFESARSVAGRFGRLLPFVASLAAARDARRRTEQVGARMIDVLRRLSEPGALLVTEDALEI